LGFLDAMFYGGWRRKLFDIALLDGVFTVFSPAEGGGSWGRVCRRHLERWFEGKSWGWGFYMPSSTVAAEQQWLIMRS